LSRSRRSSSNRRHPPARRSRLRDVATALIAAALIAGGAVAMFRRTSPPIPVPPALASLGPLAPEIEDLVRQARESIAQNPRDGLRWGR